MKNKSAKPASIHPALAEQLDAELGLSRIADTLDEFDRLKENLAKVDEIADDLQKALFTLAYIRTAFERLDLKAPELQALERALSDVLQGHSNPLFEPRRKKSKGKAAHTIRHKAVKVHAAVLLQAHFEANDGNLTKAAEAAAKALNRAGGIRSEKSLPGTVIGWREELTAKKPKDEWAAKLYRNLLKALKPDGVRSIMTGHPLALARRHAIEAAEQGLKDAVRELGK